ncbi:HIT family protein [Dactylosporangium sp. CA-139066]|uniref:HIT family protein n=1 Tax=Dactylosporangium sp. CA-139066 TaxID=3239930 RepID=UPI003D9386D2
MASIFSKILAGELPARFVWQDEQVAAFLSIAPLRPGHTLVVPRQEVDQWTAAEDGLFTRCMTVAQHVGRAVQRAWDAPRVGLVLAGFEVPHLHIHVFPTWGMDDFDFARADHHPDPAALDDAASRIRAALDGQDSA